MSKILISYPGTDTIEEDAKKMVTVIRRFSRSWRWLEWDYDNGAPQVHCVRKRFGFSSFSNRKFIPFQIEFQEAYLKAFQFQQAQSLMAHK